MSRAGSSSTRCGYCGRRACGAAAALDPPACYLHRGLLELDPSSNVAAERGLALEARRLARLEVQVYGLLVNPRR